MLSALDAFTAAPAAAPPKKGAKKMPPKKVTAPKVAPDEAVEELAEMGQNGDDQMIHATTGEIVLPPEFPAQAPEAMASVERALQGLGYSLEERTVGTQGAGPEHEETGAEEFYDVGGGDEGPTGAAASDAAADAAADAADAAGGGFGGPGGFGRGDPDDTAHAGGRPGGGTPSSGVGVGGGFAAEASPIDTALEKAVKAFTRVTALEKAEEYAKEINQSARNAGISVTDGRGYSGPPGSPEGPSFGGGEQGNDVGGSAEPSISEPTQDTAPVDPGVTEEDPGRSLTVSRTVLDSPAVTDALRRFQGASALDSFLATPNVNPATGAAMFASNMDWRDPATGVTYNFNTAAERDSWRANSDAGQRAEAGSAPAGQTVDQFKQERGQAWNSPGGGGYENARASGYNDPTSDPANPQPFAAADDPTPAQTQTGLAASAIENFSALTPRRTPRFGTTRNRPMANTMTGAPMYASRDNFDAEYYLSSNPDVASGGYDAANAYEHYEKHGRNEGRLGNRDEKKFRDDGYAGAFGGGAAVNWKRQQMQDRGYLDPETGGVRADLSSPRDAASSIGPTLRQLDERKEGRRQGFGGTYGAGGFDRYAAGYHDDDSNPLTPWVARNTADVDRAGNDVSRVRNVVRSGGYQDSFGAGGADAWILRQLASLGYMPTGDTEQDALRVQASSRKFDPMNYVPRWMRGAGASADIAKRPTPTPTTAWGGAPDDIKFQPYSPAFGG